MGRYRIPTVAVQRGPAPLLISISDVHYERETAAGGRYFHTDWRLYNRSNQTLHPVWQPGFHIAVGAQVVRSQWGGYYRCSDGWPPGRCYNSLQEQPEIKPGMTVPFVWYAITRRPEEWVRYLTFEALGWRWAFEFDPAGNIVNQHHQATSSLQQGPGEGGRA